MENNNTLDTEKMLRIAFKATFATMEQLKGKPFELGEDFDQMVANIKQDVLYNEKVVDILRTEGFTEQTAGAIIDRTMNNVVTEYFAEKSQTDTTKSKKELKQEAKQAKKDSKK